MKFFIEQIALCPKNPEKAKKLLTEIGAVDWQNDHVAAEGEVFGIDGANEADLSFNYDMLSNANELEILNYTDGDNWMNHNCRQNSISHLGMHCSEDELVKWREFFKERNIIVAQEVFTKSHTNPVIKDKRKYNYVIFDTKEILGVDLKFIVRINLY